jgi:large subunit ribosomal protein L1
MKKSKYLVDINKKIQNKDFDLGSAVSFFVDNKRSKFDETIEVSMNLGIDPRHADQMVRGVVSLPNGNGKEMRVAVFARDEKAKEATEAGADVVGAEDLAEDMQKGNLNYDRIIATPDLMGVVGRIGKILGPKGLMPNPKLGTVTADIKSACRSGKIRASSISRRKKWNSSSRRWKG